MLIIIIISITTINEIIETAINRDAERERERERERED